MSTLYISMNNALKIGIWFSFQAENSVLNSGVKVHVLASGDCSFSCICQVEFQLLHFNQHLRGDRLTEKGRIVFHSPFSSKRGLDFFFKYE